MDATASTRPGDRGPRPTLDEGRFATPHVVDRPGMRWWWQSPVPPAELVRELRAIHDAGFGEVEIAFSPGFWADEPQREALAAVLDEAGRLGIGVAATVGAAWPLQTPNTTRGTEHAAKELQYGVRYADGPSTSSGNVASTGSGGPSTGSGNVGSTGSGGVPFPFDDPDNARGARLLAVTAARVIERGDPPTTTKVHGWEGERDAIVNPERSTILDAASLVDLTAMVADGAVPLPDDGAWAVFAFWLRDCTQGVTSFLDRNAAVAATQYLDEHQFGADNLAGFERVGTEWFEDSLEYNADSLFWTPDLLDRFTARHGYDLTPYLPVLFAHGMCRYWVPNAEPVADFELSDGRGPRVRRDYYRLMTDLYIEDHLLVLQEWCASHGLAHKSQAAYGQNLEAIRSNREFVRRGGRAEGESLNAGDRAPVDREHPTWRFALDWQRSVVGGAHQGGTTRISTELGAQFGTAFAQTLGDLQRMLDKEWASGITKPFVHGCPSQAADAPWPTQSRFFDLVTEGWNDLHYPEWEHWRGLTDYWARGTVVLETGTPRTDVAIHRDGFLTTAARGSAQEDATAPARLADTEALERRGYSVQFVDPIGLAEPGAIDADGVLFDDGPAYRALVIDERALTPEAAEAIDAAASRGLRVVVVGEPPTDDSGFAAGSAGDARVREAVGRLLGRPTTARVGVQAEAADALAGLGLVPRASWAGATLLTQWRDAGARSYLLVYNTVAEPVSVEVSLEGEGAVRELDLWTGAFRAASATVGDGRTGVRVELAGLGVRVLELDRDARLAAPAASDPKWREVELSDWRLDVRTEEPAGPRDLALPGQGPADWRGVAGLGDVSGTGVYRVTVSPEGHRRFALHLGELAGSATVRVGGRAFPTVYTSGGVVDLGDAPASDPTIEIEVRTALNNAVIGCGTRPIIEGLPLVLGERHPVPQGLIGPVRVLGASD